MEYPLTTKWRRCGELRPHTLLLSHFGCWTVSYVAYLCVFFFGGGGELPPHLKTQQRQCESVNVNRMAFRRVGKGVG